MTFKGPVHPRPFCDSRQHSHALEETVNMPFLMQHILLLPLFEIEVKGKWIDFIKNTSHAVIIAFADTTAVQ